MNPELAASHDRPAGKGGVSPPQAPGTRARPRGPSATPPGERGSSAVSEPFVAAPNERGWEGP
jgi:hypothetical protein